MNRTKVYPSLWASISHTMRRRNHALEQRIKLNAQAESYAEALSDSKTPPSFQSGSKDPEYALYKFYNWTPSSRMNEEYPLDNSIAPHSISQGIGSISKNGNKPSHLQSEDDISNNTSATMSTSCQTCQACTQRLCHIEGANCPERLGQSQHHTWLSPNGSCNIHSAKGAERQFTHPDSWPATYHAVQSVNRIAFLSF
jgi:hypothetical protein